jgi:hypothetical protein
MYCLIARLALSPNKENARSSHGNNNKRRRHGAFADLSLPDTVNTDQQPRTRPMMILASFSVQKEESSSVQKKKKEPEIKEE